MLDIDIADLKRISELIHQKYNYDFRNYAMSSFKRRVLRIMELKKLSVDALLKKLSENPPFINEFLDELTVNVTEMFRDPMVFKAIREQILPVLATHPFIRIWHAGCSTGEEVYSKAIMLGEANLLHKSLLYATDLNPAVIENINRGIFPLSQMKQYSENYIARGGKKDFSDYYTAKYEWAKFHDRLKEKMVVATHNLVSDRSFNEFQLIICRNVLMYFNQNLQDKVTTLFYDSLCSLGMLGLGDKESLLFSGKKECFEEFDRKEKIFMKIQ